MKFISIKEVKSKKYVGKKVFVRGWVHRQRSGKDMAFVILRDSSGLIQCTVKAGSKHFKDVEKTSIESSIELSGTLKEDKRAPDGFEITIEDYKIIGLAERFPITKDQSEKFLLDVRHLWVRSQKMSAILKVRSKVFEAIHEYFHKKGFYEAHSPILIPGVAESGPDLFEVKYYDKKVYLAQTWQLYAEAILPGLEKIYTIIPAFRSEKSDTARHLTEYWTAEAEMAWYDLDGCIKISEELISHVCVKVAKECKEELKVLGVDPKYLLKMTLPFPRITYTEALKILEKDGMKVKWGKDLRSLEEKQLMKQYDKPLTVTHYPKDIMAFYKPRDKKDPKVAVCYDILLPGVGMEVVGGSERDPDIKELKKSLIAAGEDPSKYGFYFDTRKYGSVPHSGFGLGVERLIMWICKLKSIKDAIAFPRTIERTSP